MGKSIAGFYNYYRSKEDVLFELQLRAFETLVQSAQKACAGAKDPFGRFYTFILQHLQYVASHPDVMHVLVQEAGALPAQRRHVIRAAKERYFEIAQRLVAEVIRSNVSGNRRRRSAVDAAELERMTYALFGMLNWTYGWYQPDRHGSPETLARTIYHLSLRGLRVAHAADAAIASVEGRLTGRRLPPLLELVKEKAAS
jgi:AcrR family transcriptional regulator